MSYVLGTLENKVRWYRFDDAKEAGFELLPVLDLKLVSRFADRASAKVAALAVGLPTWRYVKL